MEFSNSTRACCEEPITISFFNKPLTFQNCIYNYIQKRRQDQNELFQCVGEYVRKYKSPETSCPNFLQISKYNKYHTLSEYQYCFPS